MKILFSCLFCFSLLTLVKGQEVVEDLINLGYEKYENEDYTGAILDFQKALKYDKENAEVYYLIGSSKSLLGEKVAAMESLDKATAIKKDYAAAYYEKGYIYLIDQNAEKAIEEFDKVVKYDPTFAQAYVSRGTARCMMEDKKGANEDWGKAKEMGIDYGAYMVCE